MMVYSDIGAYMLGRVVRAGDRANARRVSARPRLRAGGHERDDVQPARVAPARASRRRKSIRSAAAWFAARCTTSARTTLAACPRMRACSAPRTTSTRFAQMYLNDGTIDGTRVFPPRADRRSSPTRAGRRTARSAGRSPTATNSGRAPHVARRIRAHGLHRHVDLDRSDARRVHHSAHAIA